jgi:hypothetical protein
MNTPEVHHEGRRKLGSRKRRVSFTACGAFIQMLTEDAKRDGVTVACYVRQAIIAKHNTACEKAKQVQLQVQREQAHTVFMEQDRYTKEDLNRIWKTLQDVKGPR